jgi:copper chaperone CopZ
MFGKKEKSLILNVGGMTCQHCEMNVENSIKNFENVNFVKADREKSNVEIKYSGEINTDKIKEKIIEIGYKII